MNKDYLLPKNKVHRRLFHRFVFMSGLGQLFLMSAPGWRGGGHELEKDATQATSENNEGNNLLYF